MNGKFIRLFEIVLLKTLLEQHNPNLLINDYVLGIPKSNLNPITRLIGNTYIELLPRNPLPNKGAIKTYYNRDSFSEVIKNKNLIKNISITKEVYLYDVLLKISEVSGLYITEDDVYNTSIKEFHDGKLYIVLLAKPESYRYTGMIELAISKKIYFKLSGRIIDAWKN